MASSALKTGAGLLLMPGVLIGVHGLLYGMATLLVGGGTLLFGLMTLLGALSDGSSEGWLALGLVGGVGGFSTLMVLAFTLVHLILGAVVIRGAVRGLQGHGRRTEVLVGAALSAVFCGGWTLLALLALNPFVLFWGIAAILAVVAAAMVLSEPELAPAARS